MHPFEKEIWTLLRQERLIEEGETVVVGVSAGPDSMGLLHVLACLAPELHFTPVAVYVNHGLRPEEAEAERKLVDQQAELLGLAFHHAVVNVPEEARERKISIEHAARDLRYQIFANVAAQCRAQKIAVAHTADDQGEELMLRLIRGTGRAGLAGMQMIRSGTIIRPFLTSAKETILAFLHDRGIPFLTDSSNLERKFLRNRIRLDLMPQLVQFNPNIAETLRQTAMVLQDEEKLLARLTEAAWQDLVVIEEDRATGSLPCLFVDLAGFLGQDRALQRRIAEKTFIAMQSQPQFKKIEQVLFVARSGETGAMLHFSRGLRMKKEKKRLVFSFPQGRVAKRGNLD